MVLTLTGLGTSLRAAAEFSQSERVDWRTRDNARDLFLPSSPDALSSHLDATMSDAEPVLSPDPAAAKKRAPPKPSTSADPGVSLLPISRVHKIIKADKDVRLCSKEAIFLISKATVSSRRARGGRRQDARGRGRELMVPSLLVLQEFMLGKLTNTAYSSARLQKRAKLVKYQDLCASRPLPSSWC